MLEKCKSDDIIQPASAPRQIVVGKTFVKNQVAFSSRPGTVIVGTVSNLETEFHSK